MFSPPWPPPDDDIRQALERAYANGDWGRYEGEHGARLIELLHRTFKVGYVYPCCSGTFAVELALRVLHIQPGDEVLLAGYDFGGNFRAIEAVGAVPVLVDLAPNRWHVDVDRLLDAASPKTKTILVSHLHGDITPMREISAVAEAKGWTIVEDACQNPGAIAAGRAAGTWGDIGVLSFGGSKLLTAGRGGALLTNNARLMQRAKVICEQGNHAYPLSELQAAVLIPQLEKLTDRNVQRLESVRRLRERATSLDVGPAATLNFAGELTQANDGNIPAYYKLGMRLTLHDDHPQYKNTQELREKLISGLQAEGIAIDAGFRGFSRRGESRCHTHGSLDQAKQAAMGTLVLHHPVLLEPRDVIDRLVDKLNEVTQRIFQEGIE